MTKCLNGTPRLKYTPQDLMLLSGEPFVVAASQPGTGITEITCTVEGTREDIEACDSFTIVSPSELLDQEREQDP